MASGTHAGGETPFEANTQRQSLLDIVLERIQRSGKTVVVSRLIYVARFSKRETAVDHQRGFLHKIIEKHQHGGDITGMLLVYPSSCIHMLEAKTSVLMAILRDVTAAATTESRVAEARVIASTEDVPSRCFSTWFSSYVATASGVESMDALDSSLMVKAATDINSFLRRVGPTLVGLPEGEVRRRLLSLESYYDDVPSSEQILSLVPAEDAPSVEEFLEIFDSPINVDLDSEQVWPMPPAIKY